ncbi:hypothetical protein EDB92DRAFT_1945284 [Lactarius akahatsu]|uniref:Uncharacterized protein n=1 Tax=Lactarius akahatsu TaxID=416441 RepID=A0AAD4LIK3_9AGAM|nr:hypothetical protein EDB92DRAFT_1945284 [Lactarius akahatsu]
MSVNSLLVQGVRPFGVALIADMAKGIARGRQQADYALIGALRATHHRIFRVRICSRRRQVRLPLPQVDVRPSDILPGLRANGSSLGHAGASYISPRAEWHWKCAPRDDARPLARRANGDLRAAREPLVKAMVHVTGWWLVDDVKRTGVRCRWLVGAGRDRRG